MKLLHASSALLAATMTLAALATHANADCVPATVGPYLSDIGIKASVVGQIPTQRTAASSYNMAVAEGFDGRSIFIDQVEGKLYSFDMDSKKIEKIFEADGLMGPDGLDLNHGKPVNEFPNGAFAIHNVAPGPDDSIYVVFTSSSDVPSSYNGGNGIPDGLKLEGLGDEYNLYTLGGGDCSTTGDISSVCGGRQGAFGGSFAEPFCCTAKPAKKFFYKYDFSPNGKSLVNPELFFVLEMQVTYGHQGGAMLTLPSGEHAGKILYSVGDCLPFGLNGLGASQADDSHCGKMLLIDPSNDNDYEIVAKGIRNSQQMNIEGDNLVFMDIGGVTAEEVNVVPLADILDDHVVEDFGWGMKEGEVHDFGDGNDVPFAREGTYAVGRGDILQFGKPPCLGSLEDELLVDDMITPYIQYGRTELFSFFGITSSVMSDEFETIKLATAEFKTSKLIVTTEDYDPAGPVAASLIKVYKEDADGNLVWLENDMNSFVIEALNLNITAPGVSDRGDTRLFKFPDGSAGALIERTGQVLKLEEFELNDSSESSSSESSED